MRSFVYSALICTVMLGSVSVADAMPVAPRAASVSPAVSGAEIEKTVVVVTKRVVVRRPRRVVKRVIIR